MSVIYVALPIALLLAVIAVIAFVIQVRNGQFDDLETPPRRMLFDDVEPNRSEQEIPEREHPSTANDRTQQPPQDADQ
jgi:cbb3-type cytochrome oxidase maturation protein